MGPDRISDRWMRRKRNAMPYMALLEEHFNEKTFPLKGLDEANLILFSKEDTASPPIDRIRPIAAYSPLSKCREAMIDVVVEETLWS